MRLAARLFTILSISAALIGVARADEDEDDPDRDLGEVKDHPEIPRFPGFRIDSGEHNDFNEYAFNVGTDRDGNLVQKTVGGAYWDITYLRKSTARVPSAVEVIRNYENAFKKAGGKKLWSSDDEATLQMPLGKSQRYMFVSVFNQGSAVRLTIVDAKAMKQTLELNASEMLDALQRDGFVALHGIEFDSGKDTIKPESEALLAEIVTLLQDNATLKLSVEGHTDNVGEAKANLALSRKRAESVRKWLSGKGIAAARLSTNGFGDTKPVADNRTEAGRAQNRRVELVKK